MEVQPLGVAALPEKADFILGGQIWIGLIHSLNILLKFCIGVKEYLYSFLLEQLREKKIEQTFTLNILLK